MYTRCQYFYSIKGGKGFRAVMVTYAIVMSLNSDPETNDSNILPQKKFIAINQQFS